MSHCDRDPRELQLGSDFGNLLKGSRGKMREELTTAELLPERKTCVENETCLQRRCRACVAGAGRCVTDVQHRNERIADCGFGKLSSAQDGATFSGK